MSAKARRKMFCKSKQDQERYVLKNGALVLEQIITGFNGKCNPIRSFTESELKVATNNYDSSLVLRDDLYHTLYKGIQDDRQISVKKFKETSTLEWITNEIAIASNMSNHKHVLKLIGYCLETELPLIVYEFAGNGVLSNYIYNSADRQQELPWEIKLRIVTEISNAVAYVHYGTSKVILHRNLNPTNIILGEDYVAKLLDFQLAIPIPAGEDHLYAEEICGIIGYVAPEAFSGLYTEKCDVYSYGVILFELLAGERMRDLPLFDELGPFSATGEAISYEAEIYSFIDDNYEADIDNENGRSNHQNNCFERCLKAILSREGNRRQLIEFGELTLKCLKYNPDERPTMKEVSQALRSISGRYRPSV